MPATARITPRGEDRLRSGHPWIYRSDVRDVTGAGGVKTSYRSEMSLQIMTMVSTVQTFEANVPVDDAKFNPPPA